MSQQDRQFFNMFSAVIGVLVTIAVVLFGIARSIGMPFEAARTAADSAVAARVAENTAPIGHVAVAGQDNAALAIKARGAAAPAALPVP